MPQTNNNKNNEYEELRKWRRKHDPVERAKKAEWDKNWRTANREKKNATNRAWKSKNLEYRIRELERVRRWRLNNPDKIRRINAKRRAQQAEGLSRFGWIDERLISNYLTRMCGICELLIEGKYEIDHIIPLSRNGTHTIDNLQLSHPICNRTKSGRLQKDMRLDIFILRELVS